MSSRCIPSRFCYRRFSVVMVEQGVGALLCCRLSLAVSSSWTGSLPLFCLLQRWSGEFAPIKQPRKDSAHWKQLETWEVRARSEHTNNSSNPTFSYNFAGPIRQTQVRHISESVPVVLGSESSSSFCVSILMQCFQSLQVQLRLRRCYIERQETSLPCLQSCCHMHRP